jgi:pimeloyl-ACP methyl ester carboxylesterase
MNSRCNADVIRRVAHLFWKLLLAAYAGLLALIFFGHIVDRLVVFPNHQAIEADGAQQLLIPSGQGTIEVWKARSPGSKDQEPAAFILRFVGQGDRAERRATSTARQWRAKPVEVWAMNYPGSGGSTGPPRLDELCPSAEQTYDALRKVAGQRPVFVQANSLGTAVALCLATRRPIAGLILDNPAPLRQVILDRYGWWNLWLLAWPASMQIPSRLDAIANASQSKVPAIMIHSEKDTSIPQNLQRLVDKAYQGRKREILVLGAGHMSPLTPEAEVQFSENLEWLWREAYESH